MKFLVDEDLPRSSVALLNRYGYEAIDVREIGLKGAKDPQIAAYIQSESMCLLTGDQDFAVPRNYPPSKYSGLVVLKIPVNAVARDILDLIKSFIEQDSVVNNMSGKLAIVEQDQVRIKSKP